MRNPQPGSAPAAVNLPTIMEDLRAVLRSLDWENLRDDVRREAAARLAIVGPVNSGKSTLFNLMEGKKVSEVSPIPGTTKVPLERSLGPFILVDTPGFGEVGGVDRANTGLEERIGGGRYLAAARRGGRAAAGGRRPADYLQGLRGP